MKKIIFPYLLGGLFTFLLVFYGLYRFTNYLKSLSIVNVKSELQVVVDKFSVDRGAIFINDSYLIPGPIKLLESSDSLIQNVMDLDYLVTPSEIKKDSGSMKVVVMHKDGGYSVLLLKK